MPYNIGNVVQTNEIVWNTVEQAVVSASGFTPSKAGFRKLDPRMYPLVMVADLIWWLICHGG